MDGSAYRFNVAQEGRLTIAIKGASKNSTTKPDKAQAKNCEAQMSDM